MDFINKNKVIGAYIVKPYTNSGESFDYHTSHGWQVSLIVGYVKGYPNSVVINKETEQECKNLINKLGLISI